jgi:hypothetical protein
MGAFTSATASFKVQTERLVNVEAGSYEAWKQWSHHRPLTVDIADDTPDHWAAESHPATRDNTIQLP